MADHVQAVWLLLQSPALRALLADREHKLGYNQAHPFGTFEFTDDFLDITPDTQLTATGALIRRKMAKEMNLWMSSKAEAGSCVDYIGGRHVICGGFGTLSPHKRTRCYETCGAAMEGELTLEDFLAHNSFLVHVRDLLDFDVHLLEGNWLPSKVLKYPWAKVLLSEHRFDRIRENYTAIQIEVATRPAASFATGFFDAPRGAHTVLIPSPVLYLHMDSDCRADGEITCIFGALMEYEWRICLSDLDRRWARRHINVGESSGAAVNVAVFGTAFQHFEIIQGGDNRAEGPMLLGKSKVQDQRAIGKAMRRTDGYKACFNSLWFEHNSGKGLGFVDAGSRDKLSVLDNLAASFGRRRVRIDATAVPGVLEMLSAILDTTTDYVKPKRSGYRVWPLAERPSSPPPRRDRWWLVPQRRTPQLSIASAIPLTHTAAPIHPPTVDPRASGRDRALPGRPVASAPSVDFYWTSRLPTFASTAKPHTSARELHARAPAATPCTLLSSEHRRDGCYGRGRIATAAHSIGSPSSSGPRVHTSARWLILGSPLRILLAGTAHPVHSSPLLRGPWHP